MSARLIYVVLLSLIINIIPKPGWSQIPKNTWRDHLNYNKAKVIALAGDKVYCATDYALFYYNKPDNSIHKLTPINGLSEIGIGYIAYNDSLQKLIIGYSSGNIDILMNDGSKMNFPDLKQKDFSGDKTIYHINISGKMAYLSCGFGLVAFNMDKNEFSDTYILGNQGQYLKINCSAVYKGYLYALTDSGVMRGDLSNPFLGDIKNWEYIEDLTYPHNPYNTGTIFNGKLYVNNTLENNDTCIISVFDGSKWEIAWDNFEIVKSLNCSNNCLIRAAKWNIDAENTDGSNAGMCNDYYAQQGLIDESGVLWFADSKSGLAKYKSGNRENICPSGPASNDFFNVQYNAGDMLIAPGGFRRTGSGIFKQADVYTFSDEKWSSIDMTACPEIDPLRCVINFATHASKDYYYAATWGYGLLEINGENINIYNNESTDSILSNFIGGCAFDNDGNLWMGCTWADNPIVVKTTDGKWYSYAYTGSSGNTLSGKQVGRLLHTSNDDFWLVSQKGEGIMVWNANGTPENQSDDDFCFISSLRNEENATYNFDINAIVEDNEGVIWLGTNEGIVVYDSPWEVFTTNENKFYARKPQMVVDGYYQDLLGKEAISAIVVDGANRKWIGTSGSGLFLISADGTEQLALYNIDNSPLYSNNILSLAINDETGELFIITENGLQSFMTTATAANESFSDIYTFPNPVKPGYEGLITIRGLMKETIVKITDLAGNLVYETTSNGGDAVWNGRNLNGQKVVAGTYIVMCVTSDGSQGEFTKIHIIK
jgi:hypothetical protein